MKKSILVKSYLKAVYEENGGSVVIDTWPVHERKIGVISSDGMNFYPEPYREFPLSLMAEILTIMSRVHNIFMARARDD